jgi:hypothetical protein
VAFVRRGSTIAQAASTASPYEQHGISQKALIGINLVRGVFLDGRKLCGHGGEFFARTFHSGAEAERDLTWTETEAEIACSHS